MIYQFRCVNEKCILMCRLLKELPDNYPDWNGYFEVEQGIFDEHHAYCPKCKAPAQRVYTPLPFQFGKADYNSDGSRDLNPDLPHVPRGSKFTHGWTPKEEK